MDAFPLTREKLLKQPVARRHKLVCQWLKSQYLQTLETPRSQKEMAYFLANYLQLLQWLGESTLLCEPQSQREILEFLSDRYHYHKQKSGIGFAEHNLLPRVIRGDKPGDAPWKASLSYRVALDNIRSAFNVGSIVRVADAVGFEGVITGGMTPNMEHPQVIKTAMGCTDWIPREHAEHLPDLLEHLKTQGSSIIGIETVAGSHNHIAFPWPSKGVVVMGNEEYGLSTPVLAVCDSFVHLPMQGRKNSINVANAFAVIAFHIAFSSKIQGLQREKEDA